MTYAELKSLIVSMSKRKDLTANVPTYLTLAEVDINRRMRTSYAINELEDTESNWLLDKAPDVYLHGALLQLAMDCRDIDSANAESALYLGFLEAARIALAEEQGSFDVELETEIPVSRRSGNFHWGNA